MTWFSPHPERHRSRQDAESPHPKTSILQLELVERHLVIHNGEQNLLGGKIATDQVLAPLNNAFTRIVVVNNIFTDIPEDLQQEHFSDLIRTENVRIERIVSFGQTSPESGWYDQDENEWVIVLQGAGTIQFEDGREITLDTGGYINIPAHARHRVSWTLPDKMTLWLAVFYR